MLSLLLFFVMRDSDGAALTAPKTAVKTRVLAKSNFMADPYRNYKLLKGMGNLASSPDSCKVRLLIYFCRLLQKGITCKQQLYTIYSTLFSVLLHVKLGISDTKMALRHVMTGSGEPRLDPDSFLNLGRD